MAIRYVAPTFDQPTQREMNERAARQRNLFGAGRNLSRAFVRQAAIDYALQQQAAERQAGQAKQQGPTPGPQQLTDQSLGALQQQFAERARADAVNKVRQQNQTAALNAGLLAASNFDDQLAGMRVSDVNTDNIGRAVNPMAGLPGAPVMRGDRLAGQRTRLGREPEVESFAGAGTRFPNYSDRFSARPDPEAGASRMARVKEVGDLGYTRMMDQGERSFGEGGLGVVDSDPTDTSGLALGVDEPLDLSALKNRYRFSPNLKKSMRLAGIAEKNYAPNKTVEELWGDFDKAEDQASWIIDYLKKEPKNNQWDRGFRASLVRIFAQHFEGPDFRDLSGGTLDLDGRTLQPPNMDNLSSEEQNALSQLQELNYYRKLRETLNRQLQEGDDGLFDPQILGDFLPLNEG